MTLRPRCLVCHRFLTSDFRCSWWGAHMHRRDSVLVRYHDGTLTKKGTPRHIGYRFTYYDCYTLDTPQHQWITVSYMLETLYREMGFSHACAWGRPYQNYLKMNEPKPPKKPETPPKSAVPEVLDAAPIVAPPPFEQWRTPQDVAIAIQRIHHALLTGAMSFREATAHVGLLKLYLANMFLAGPAAVLPDYRKVPSLEGDAR